MAPAPDVKKAGPGTNGTGLTAQSTQSRRQEGSPTTLPNPDDRNAARYPIKAGRRSCVSSISNRPEESGPAPIVRRPSDDAPTISAVTWSKTLAARNEQLYGWSLVDNSPDSRPAVRLRLELERDRYQGFAFDQVWADEVDWALDPDFGLSERDIEQWRRAFAFSESAFRAAYDRTETDVSSLQADLLAA
jgi:hypothetical protein